MLSKLPLDSTKSIPLLYEKKEDCCGCGACLAICPKNAIIMKVDEEGFEYPYICSNLCIGCYRCIKVCPIKGESQ